MLVISFVEICLPNPFSPSNVLHSRCLSLLPCLPLILLFFLCVYDSPSFFLSFSVSISLANSLCLSLFLCIYVSPSFSLSFYVCMSLPHLSVFLYFQASLSFSYSFSVSMYLPLSFCLLSVSIVLAHSLCLSLSVSMYFPYSLCFLYLYVSPYIFFFY